MPARVSLADYGGRGDGHTDNTPALVRALASGAGTIVTPPGQWYFAAMSRLPTVTHRVFLGEPGSAWVFGAGLAADGTQAWHHCTFQGLTFRAPTAWQAPHGQNFTLFGRGCTALTFAHCTIEDVSIAFLNGCLGPITVTGCRFTQSDHPPARRNASMANVVGPWTVTECVWDFMPASPAHVLVQVLGAPPGRVLVGPYRFERNQVFPRGLPGQVVDGAFDIEPHQPQPVSTVVIADNLIQNASLYVSGAQTLTVRGNTLRFTAVGYAAPHAPPVTTYSSYRGTPPPTGTLAITGNTIVLDPIPTDQMQATPLQLRGSGAIGQLIVAGNTIQCNPLARPTANNSNVHKVLWADARTTPSWGTVTIQDNRVVVPGGTFATPGPLFTFETGQGGFGRITLTGNAVSGAGGATGFVAVPHPPGPGRVGQLILTDNTVTPTLPLVAPESQPVGAAVVSGNTGLTGTVPVQAVGLPAWMWITAVGAGAVGAGAWYAAAHGLWPFGPPPH
jgi:hypothetical protein